MVEDPNELQNRFDDPAVAGIQADLIRRLALWQMSKDDRIPANSTVGLSFAAMPVADRAEKPIERNRDNVR